MYTSTECYTKAGEALESTKTNKLDVAAAWRSLGQATHHLELNPTASNNIPSAPKKAEPASSKEDPQKADVTSTKEAKMAKTKKKKH